MFPYELEVDKEGLLYIQDKKILTRTPLLIDHRDVSDNRYYQSGFYRIFSTPDYIIKYSYTCYTKKEQKEIKEMLSNFVSKQEKVLNVDFPIGYFKSGRSLCGLIIKYYANSVSLDDVMREKDIELLGKYYAHDEDTIHNMFLLFNDVLNDVYEMFENGICYTDINPGNIILTDNKTKIIDFDTRFVKFDKKDLRLYHIMESYCLLLKTVLSKYHLLNDLDEKFKDFEEAKIFTKKLDNNIRRGN